MESRQKEVGALGGKCLALTCDVTSKQDIDNVACQTAEQFGGIDILVNNAQTGLTPVPWEDLTDEFLTPSLKSYLDSSSEARTEMGQSPGPLRGRPAEGPRPDHPFLGERCFWVSDRASVLH